MSIPYSQIRPRIQQTVHTLDPQEALFQPCEGADRGLEDIGEHGRIRGVRSPNSTFVVTDQTGSTFFLACVENQMSGAFHLGVWTKIIGAVMSRTLTILHLIISVLIEFFCPGRNFSDQLLSLQYNLIDCDVVLSTGAGEEKEEDRG